MKAIALKPGWQKLPNLTAEQKRKMGFTVCFGRRNVEIFSIATDTRLILPISHVEALRAALASLHPRSRPA